MVGTGLFLGGAATSRQARVKSELEERRIGLAENQGALRVEQARRKAISEGIDATRTEINGLIDVAREAKGKGATPGQLSSIRRLIELQGGQLGIAMPGIPQPQGARPVPGSEAVIQNGLNRFDALVGATQAEAAGGPFQGTGFQAQTSNILVQLSEKLKTGVPLTSEEKAAYSIAYGEATRPRVVGTPGGGFSFVEPTIDETLFPRPETIGAPPVETAPADLPQTPTATTPATAQTPAQGAPGARVTPIAGPQRQPANEAGRATLVSQAAQTVREVRSAIVNPDGSVNRDLVATMVAEIPFMGAGLPFTEGRTVRAQIEDVLSAKLRLETGATANAEEVQNLVDRFLPSLLDKDATIIDKTDRLVAFFDEALSKTDPDLFKSLTDRARGEGRIPDPPEGEEGATFDRFDPQRGLAVFRRPNGELFGVPQRAGTF